MLLDAGAMVDAEDVEGNTPLHVKCYGESNKASDMTSLELLLNKNASLSKRNTRVGNLKNVTVCLVRIVTSSLCLVPQPYMMKIGPQI